MKLGAFFCTALLLLAATARAQRQIVKIEPPQGYGATAGANPMALVKDELCVLLNLHKGEDSPYGGDAACMDFYDAKTLKHLRRAMLDSEKGGRGSLAPRDLNLLPNWKLAFLHGNEICITEADGSNPAFSKPDSKFSPLRMCATSGGGLALLGRTREGVCVMFCDGEGGRTSAKSVLKDKHYEYGADRNDIIALPGGKVALALSLHEKGEGGREYSFNYWEQRSLSDIVLAVVGEDSDEVKIAELGKGQFSGLYYDEKGGLIVCVLEDSENIMENRLQAVFFDENLNIKGQSKVFQAAAKKERGVFYDSYNTRNLINFRSALIFRAADSYYRHVTMTKGKADISKFKPGQNPTKRTVKFEKSERHTIVGGIFDGREIIILCGNYREPLYLFRAPNM